MSQNYAGYITGIYNNELTADITTRVTADFRGLEDQARRALGARAFSYVSGGAGELGTMHHNRLAFQQWQLTPRMMRDMSAQDVSVELFGQKYANPILMAPVGVQSIFHEDKDTGVAEVCQELDVPFIMSTASTSSIEEIAAANKDGKRWFQLYWPHDSEVTLSLLKRAKESGFSVLVITLDTWALAWRAGDLDEGYVPFFQGIGNQVGFSDPVFRTKYEGRTGKKIEDDIVQASREWVSDLFAGKAHTWEDLAFIRKNWDGPIVLKGIQHVEDAKLALQHGCDGIIVSNHGGRQVDGAVGSLDVLPEIVDAVGDQLTVLFDSGIRSGADIIKALCLGAKAVLAGRPVIYGLGIAGKKGAKHVLQGLLADFQRGMALTGLLNVDDCNRSKLRRGPAYGTGQLVL
ncbi:FMN-dependent dehydrogenase [Aspergillus karnatakaensis]|uniref:lactate 2-monooxygenase n=1 Tax=Aspergillus karnatakaensis TaxID=1810916 RepID=UPI003CCE04D2